MSPRDLERWAEAIGWIAALALLWNLVILPIATFVLPILKITVPATEPLDIAETLAIVGSAVGMGYVRRPIASSTPGETGPP